MSEQDDGTVSVDEEPATQPEEPQILRAATDFYSVRTARFDQNLQLLSLARLPPWEQEVAQPPVPTGHGWGYHLDELLGQGIARGELVAFAADRAGAGKTALVAQLIDGMITRSLLIAQQAQPEQRWGNVMTPVLVLSEMDHQQLAWRSGARWLGVSSQTFRGGLSYRNRLRTDDMRLANDQNWERFFRLLDPDTHPFGDARQWWLKSIAMSYVFQAMDRNSEEFGDILVQAIRNWVNDLTGPKGEYLPEGTVRPVVVVDPIQRSQQLDLPDVEALNRLARMLRTRAQQEGWVVMMTSDTNKVSATGATKKESTAIEEAAAAFRGSYGLQHELSTALYLRRPPTVRDLKPLEVEIVIPKSRWGAQPKGTPDDPWPRFEWQPQFLRFVPLSRGEAIARATADAEANAKAKSKKGSKDDEEEERYGADRVA